MSFEFDLDYGCFLKKLGKSWEEAAEEVVTEVAGIMKQIK